VIRRAARRIPELTYNRSYERPRGVDRTGRYARRDVALRTECARRWMNFLNARELCVFPLTLTDSAIPARR